MDLSDVIHLTPQDFKAYGYHPSEMLKGESDKAFPCCGSSNRDCTPFPACCNCPQFTAVEEQEDSFLLQIQLMFSILKNKIEFFTRNYK